MRGLGVTGTGRAGRALIARFTAAGLCPEHLAETADAARQAEFRLGLQVLVLVSDDVAEVEALLFEGPRLGRDVGMLSHIVIVGTLPLRYVRALRGRIARQVALADLPFSGGMRALSLGRAAFHLGATPEAAAEIAPLLQALGAPVSRMGPFGAGTAAKVMQDALATSANAMTRLALDWAAAQGLDDRALLDMSGTLLAGLNGPLRDRPEEETSAVDCDHLSEAVEAALDSALCGAQLTPPRAHGQIVRPGKDRTLH
ncbi:MAG: NAD(P)-dependent oxidoreductase [Defluviimonas sp.]|uniref:NAD(P)-binding domain-containing protein n=1 Tax=Albidovulum sp. TaxID=1872424 RepID=UPI001DAC2914|nr:NAD(P)-dependent oxidoreductase [Paracoccaceae bacterium]MCC0064440.1 NAD(P)-dependent oxidoreductase [Defluviimonas sp.]